MKKRKRYRYISNGGAKPSDSISNFRLIGGNQLKQLDCRFNDVIRVAIPDDMELEKYSCDGYSTTEDERTLAELNFNVIVRFKDGFVRRPDFERRQLDESILGDISERLRQEGYYLTNDGYLDKHDYNAYMDRIAEAAEEREERADKLKAELDARKCSPDDLEYIDKDVLINVLGIYVCEKRKLNATREDAAKALIELSSNTDEADKAVKHYLGDVSVSEKISYIQKTFGVEIFHKTGGNENGDYVAMLQTVIDQKWRS